MNDTPIQGETMTRYCQWCGWPLHPNKREAPSHYVARRHCDRSCQVSSQNSERAREKRTQ